MKEIGNWIERAVLVNFTMQTEIFMRENGRIIKQTARGFIYIKTVHFMMDNGRMTCMMVRDRKIVNLII